MWLVWEKTVGGFVFIIMGFGMVSRLAKLYGHCMSKFVFMSVRGEMKMCDQPLVMGEMVTWFEIYCVNRLQVDRYQGSIVTLSCVFFCEKNLVL